MNMNQEKITAGTTSNKEDTTHLDEVHSETEQIERKERKETFELRVDQLSAESYRSSREREITHAFENVMSEGVQSLIDEYGSQRVLKILKDMAQSIDSSNFTTYHVIKALKPEQDQRESFYKKILNDANEADSEIKQKNEEGDVHPRSNLLNGSGNFPRLVEFNVMQMKSFDTFIGRLTFKSRESLSGFSEKFAVIVSQDLDVEAKFTEGLNQAGDNGFRLVEERRKIEYADLGKLRAEINGLQDELLSEIQHITDELNIKLEEYRATILSDISKFGNTETASEEMRSALQNVLTEVESKIIDKVHATQSEIASKIKPYNDMIDQLDLLKRS